VRKAVGAAAEAPGMVPPSPPPPPPPTVDELPEVEYRDGLHLVGSVVWFDAARVRDLAFISHAHVQALLPHRKVLMTEGTLRLLRAGHPTATARLRAADVLTCPFGRRFSLGSLDIELLPAGHVLGSAQLLLRTARGHTVLYAGDVCLDRRPTVEACEVRRADVLVLDNTFGAPPFRFPARARTRAAVLEWVQQTLDAGEVPVVLAEPLGAAQELVQLFAGEDVPVRAHAAIHRYARPFAQAGIELAMRRLGAAPRAGEVVLLPPGAQLQLDPERWRDVRVALCSAWAVRPEVAARAPVHATFPLPDHAGYDDLLRFVEAVAPRVVYLTRAPAPAFLAALGARGVLVRTAMPPAQLDLFGRP
jgi:Cft2 family RNA processing exonuclease